MAVDRDTVLRIARLARIRIGDDEAEGLSGELNNILGWIEQLGEVDTSDVPPMTSVVAMKPVLREDRVADDKTGGGRAGEVVKNAPEQAHDFFVVPKVIE